LAQPLGADNGFKECGVGLSFILGFCQCDRARYGGGTRVSVENHECGVCLGNSVFDGVLGLSITAAKFAPEIIKFCCNCVSVENSVFEVEGYQLERLLQDERRDAKFNHCDV